jgi:hypothetical protein
MSSKDVWKERKSRKEGLLGRKEVPLGSQGRKPSKEVKESSQGRT